MTTLTQNSPVNCAKSLDFVPSSDIIMEDLSDFIGDNYTCSQTRQDNALLMDFGGGKSYLLSVVPYRNNGKA